jgi:hypothetical protein
MPSMTRLLMGIVGAYLIGVGILAGMALDRILYDRQRSEVLQRYEETLREWRAHQMDLEKQSVAHR